MPKGRRNNGREEEEEKIDYPDPAEDILFGEDDLPVPVSDDEDDFGEELDI